MLRHLYIAKLPRLGQPSGWDYMLYHELPIPDALPRILTGVSAEYLVGYVNAAIGMESRLLIPHNGLPPALVSEIRCSRHQGGPGLGRHEIPRLRAYALRKPELALVLGRTPLVYWWPRILDNPAPGNCSR